MKTAIILITVFSIPALAFSATIYVPDHYPTIQEAIDESANGDTIIVRAGTYMEGIDFKGKAITVASKFYLDGDISHISKTILDGSYLKGSDKASLVYFVNGEDISSVLSGFTLQNGHGTKMFVDELDIDGTEENYLILGGAILVFKSGAKIENNMIRNNKAISPVLSEDAAYGGGLTCDMMPNDKSLIVENNIFTNNATEGKWALGGGVVIVRSLGEVLISQNRFIKNRIICMSRY